MHGVLVCMGWSLGELGCSLGEVGGDGEDCVYPEESVLLIKGEGSMGGGMVGSH